MRRIVVVGIGLAAALAACRKSKETPEPPVPGEPNDTFAQAIPIQPTSVTGAALGSASDHDYFSFAVPAGGGILRALTFDGTGTGCAAGLATEIDLYDALGNAIATSGPGLGGCSELLRYLPAGGYAVDVHGTASAYPGAYTLVTTLVPTPGSPTLRAFVQGSLASTTAVQCTAVGNGTGAPVTLWLETYVGGMGACASAVAGQDDTVLRVLDSAGPVVASDDDGGIGACSQLYHALPAGTTRYVCVTPKPGSVVPAYQLLVDTDTEPNDTFAQASPIAATSATGAWLGGAADHDYYSFTVAAGGGVFRAMTFDGTGTGCAAGLSTAIDLYDGAGNAVAASGAGIGGCSELLRFLPEGSYAVDVHGTASTYPAPYVLVISLTVPVATRSLETTVPGSLAATTDVACSSIANGTAADLTIRLATSVGGFGSCTSVPPGENDTVLRVLDATGPVVASDDDGGVAPCSQLYQLLPAGETRTVCVTAKPGTVVPSYELLVAGGSEPNDAIVQATPIAATSETRGWLSSSADHDDYAFTVGAGGGILRAMTFDEVGTGCSPELFADVVLYDSGGTSIATGDNPGGGTSGACSELLAFLQPGTYVLDVNDLGAKSAYPAPYRLVTSLAPPPTPPRSADALFPSESIPSITDFDCWTLSNGTADAVQIHLETFVGGVGSCTSATLQNDTLLRVLDGNGAIDAWDDDGGIDTCSLLDYSLAAGATRYACVTSLDPWVIPSYQLEIDFWPLAP